MSRNGQPMVPALSTLPLDTAVVTVVVATMRSTSTHTATFATTSLPMGWYPPAPDPEQLRLAALRETKRAVLGPRRSRWG